MKGFTFNKNIIFKENEVEVFELKVAPVVCDCTHPKCHGLFVPTRVGQERCYFWLEANNLLDHYPLLCDKTNKVRKDGKVLLKFNNGLVTNRSGEKIEIIRSYRVKDFYAKSFKYQYCYRYLKDEKPVWFFIEHKDLLEWIDR